MIYKLSVWLVFWPVLALGSMHYALLIVRCVKWVAAAIKRRLRRAQAIRTAALVRTRLDRRANSN